MSPRDPQLVVAICTYNNARVLRDALASLVQQRTMGELRWGAVVVDNNCTDETEAIVEQWRREGQIPGLELLQEPQQGLLHARRRAVVGTTAPLIAFVDDDCRLDPDWVQRAFEFFSGHPRAGVAGGRVSVVWEEPPPKWLQGFGRSFAEQDHGSDALCFPEEGVVRLVGAGFICRRSALEACGWLDYASLVGRKGAVLSAGEDIELVLRIREAGFEAWYTPTLHLLHFIPVRRMAKGYVYRLHRGFGQARIALYFIEARQPPTLGRAVRALGYAAKTLVLSVMALPSRDAFASMSKRAAVCEAFGQIEGAWRLLAFQRLSPRIARRGESMRPQ